MSKTLVSEITIAAPANAVWEVLTDFAAYREWNPFIVEAAGQGAGREQTDDPDAAGGWPGDDTATHGRGGAGRREAAVAGTAGAALAARCRALVPAGGATGGRYRLVQTEVFSGALSRWSVASSDRGTLPAFRLMDEALEKRAVRDAVAPDHD